MWPWIVWFCMAIEENVYFGWHTAPKSDAELIADLLCGLAALLILTRSKQ